LTPFSFFLFSESEMKLFSELERYALEPGLRLSACLGV